MLARIRTGLSATGEQLRRQADAFPPPHGRGPFVATDLACVEQFRAELSALHAQVHLCAGPAAALVQIEHILEELGARTALAWDAAHLPLPETLERLARRGIRLIDPQVAGHNRPARYVELERAEVGITGVDIAVAESGSMIVLSGAGRPRLASLLPPAHIALLPAERIVRTLPQAFDRLRAEHGEALFGARSNLVIITGPSRTADIELSLTLGVHGPRQVHAVVICPPQPSSQGDAP